MALSQELHWQTHLGVDSYDPGSLQKVGADEGAADTTRHVEAQLHKLAEPRRVIVAARLRVAERLQQRIAFQHLPSHHNLASTGSPGLQ